MVTCVNWLFPLSRLLDGCWSAERLHHRNSPLLDLPCWNGAQGSSYRSQYLRQCHYCEPCLYLFFFFITLTSYTLLRLHLAFSVRRLFICLFIVTSRLHNLTAMTISVGANVYTVEVLAVREGICALNLKLRTRLTRFVHERLSLRRFGTSLTPNT